MTKAIGSSSPIETFSSVSRTVSAEIWCDAFSGRFVIEKFEGRSERSGELLMVKKSFAPTLHLARDAANNWIESRA